MLFVRLAAFDSVEVQLDSASVNSIHKSFIKTARGARDRRNVLPETVHLFLGGDWPGMGSWKHA